jgi:hypothetical protein
MHPSTKERLAGAAIIITVALIIALIFAQAISWGANSTRNQAYYQEAAHYVLLR